MDDMKLREYTMMVVHLILSGNQFGKARVDTAASELIIGCLSVATQTESENGFDEFLAMCTRYWITRLIL